jgi:putative addiction module component (TIGR02574 family)
MTATLAEQVKRLSLEEKFELLDLVWSDLAGAAEDLPVSDAHLAELDRREERLRTGEAELLDLEEVKRRGRERRA